MQKCKITITGDENHVTLVSRVDFEIIKAFANILDARGYKCEIKNFFVPNETDIIQKNWPAVNADITNCVSLD